MSEPLTIALISELMPKLHAAFPRNLGASNPTVMVETYRNGLRGLSGDAVRAAVERAIQDDEYFPKVARLRELAQSWQRRNQPAMPPQLANTSPDVCHICGVRAAPKTISRLKRDPAKGYALVLNAHGQPQWEEVESTMRYIDHDPVKHRVFASEER